MARNAHRIRFGEEARPDWMPEPAEPCGDCGARRGEYHGANCQYEQCPQCHGQMISCLCPPRGEEG